MDFDYCRDCVYLKYNHRKSLDCCTHRDQVGTPIVDVMVCPHPHRRHANPQKSTLSIWGVQ